MSHRPSRGTVPRLLTAGLLLAALAACSGGGSDDRADAPPSTTGGPSPTNDPDTPTYSMPTQDRTLPTFTEGAEMAEWLPFGVLDVRVLDYKRAGVAGAGDSRIDVITVEECSDKGSATVRHTTWRLVDKDGRTLGVAGGKIVHGQPTEDPPRTLTQGQCMQTSLAIGMPPGSRPVAVKDGPDNTWILAV